MAVLLSVVVCAVGAASVPAGLDGGSLVVNEVMVLPLASATTELGQWIELYNNSGVWVDVSEWVIENEIGDEIHFSSHVIPPGGYFVVGASAIVDENGDYTPDDVWSSFSLDATGSLLLHCDNHDISEFFSWDSSWGVTPGASLERINPGWAASDPTTWSHSTAAFGCGDFGTPGSQNSVYSNGFGQNTWAFIKAFVH